MRKSILGLAGALLVGALTSQALAQSAHTNLTDPGQVYTFRQASQAIMCQCGCNMILDVCNHVNCPSAVPFRKEIEAMIQEGKTKDEIVAAFVAEHGEKVLSAPPAKGFNLAAWVTPFILLALGGVFLGSFLRARNSAAIASEARSRAAAAPEAGDPRVDAELGRYGD